MQVIAKEDRMTIARGGALPSFTEHLRFEHVTWGKDVRFGWGRGTAAKAETVKTVVPPLMEWRTNVRATA